MALVCLSVAGCAQNAVFLRDAGKPYEELQAKLGPPRGIDSLPPSKLSEVNLGPMRQANGTFSDDDGTFELGVGRDGQCLYVFKINPETRRLVSWRFASKGNPDSCIQGP